MAQNPYARLEGHRVVIDKLTGPFRSCVTCGCSRATVSTKPVGTHFAHLTCDDCGSITAWLSRDHMAAMVAALGPEDEREAS